MKEYITYHQLIQNKRWKNETLLPDSCVLQLYVKEFYELMPKLMSCQNFRALQFLRANITEIPSEAFELTQLEWLSLANNKLRQLPKEIAKLQNLRFLDLSDNKIARLPEALFACENLEQLYLDDNALIELPESISKLKSLNTLYLSDNLLSRLPASFSKLRTLREVSICNNQISEISGDFSAWSQLRYLYLCDNPLQKISNSLPVISLNLEEVNRLTSYLLSNQNLRELNIYDSDTFDSKEEMLSNISLELQQKENLLISEVDW